MNAQNPDITSSSPRTQPSETLLSCQSLLFNLARMQHHVEAALSYSEGTHTFDDIVKMVLNGRLYFIPLEDSFLMTEIVTYPRTKHLNVFLAGGDLDEIRGQQKPLEEMALLAGCSMLTLSGRRGWIKALEQLGWEESHTTAFYRIKEKKDG